MRRFPLTHDIVLETNEVLTGQVTTYNARFIVSHPKGVVNVNPDITSDEARDMTQAKAEDLLKVYQADIDAEIPV